MNQSTTINGRIIQPKKRDDDTDKKLSDVFKDVCRQARQHHEQLINLACMINISNNDTRFNSWVINH
jgi:hypothetical protein